MVQVVVTRMKRRKDKLGGFQRKEISRNRCFVYVEKEAMMRVPQPPRFLVLLTRWLVGLQAPTGKW